MAGAAAQVRGGNRAAAPTKARAERARPGFWRPIWFSLRAVWDNDAACRLRGGACAAFGALSIAAFLTYHADDPSWNTASAQPTHNMLGRFGAKLADLGVQSLGIAAWVAAIVLLVAGFSRALARDPRGWRSRLRMKSVLATIGILLLAGALAAPRPPAAWPLARGLGGFWGDVLLSGVTAPMYMVGLPAAKVFSALILLGGALGMLIWAAGLKRSDFAHAGAWLAWGGQSAARTAQRLASRQAALHHPRYRRRGRRSAVRPRLDPRRRAAGGEHQGAQGLHPRTAREPEDLRVRPSRRLPAP
jgi:S-DNA-T family DNA segregation ATPase FtsK/SpoIIIE